MSEPVDPPGGTSDEPGRLGSARAVAGDLKGTEAAELFGLAAAMLALGAVYWAVRDQDRKDRSDRPPAEG